MKDERLELAKAFGADLCYEPFKTDVAAEVAQTNGRLWLRYLYRSHRPPSSVTQGMSMIRKLGRFVEFSVFSAPATLDWSIIGDRKELDVLGSHLSPYCYPYVIENIASGRLKTDGVVSKTFPIEQWETAFDYATGRARDFKVAITF
jgi:L-iditol 2-dehydrogenase